MSSSIRRRRRRSSRCAISGMEIMIKYNSVSSDSQDVTKQTRWLPPHKYNNDSRRAEQIIILSFCQKGRNFDKDDDKHG